MKVLLQKRIQKSIFIQQNNGSLLDFEREWDFDKKELDQGHIAKLQ